MTQLIHWIKHVDRFDYNIFVCCLQYLLTSSLVRHNIFEFVKRLNNNQRILENMKHALIFTPNLIQRVVWRGILNDLKMPDISF
jgi:hypothetical protein